jgi:energy-converting hydrogenase B subunit D
MACSVFWVFLLLPVFWKKESDLIMTPFVLILLTIVICAGILIGGLLAVILDNMVSAVISAGLASLFASVVYVILAAPDVAMTEASIGSGLTTMIFLYAIRKTQKNESSPGKTSAESSSAERAGSGDRS